MRFSALSAALVVALSTTALAAPPKAAAPAAPGKDPVLATVNGEAIHLSDISAMAQNLPAQQQRQLAQIPPEKLAGFLLTNIINEKALLAEARKAGVDKKPDIQRQVQSAGDEIVASAYLRAQVLPKLTEDAVKAEYDKQYAGKPGEEEVHARHILVDSEAKAQDIIKQLDSGAKFDDLAKKYGDPKDGATQQGGDLGWFKKGDMLPEFSDVAFKLKPNEYTHTPVKTRYGYHVIQVLETRISPPPAYDQVHDQIRQQLAQKLTQQVIEQAKAQARVQVMKPPAAPAGATPAAPAPAAK